MKHMVMRLAHIVLGLVLIGHAAIHLGIIPGGIPGPDGRTGWSGHSGLLDQFLSPSILWAIGVVLVAGTILFFVAGGLGLFGVPFLKERWKAAAIVASALSLLLSVQGLELCCRIGDALLDGNASRHTAFYGKDADGGRSEG